MCGSNFETVRNQRKKYVGCVPGADWRSEGMGTQEGCRDGPVGDAPSGRDAAWGVFIGVKIL